MDVRVDQTGHKSPISEIDDLRIGRMFYRGPDFGDAIAFDENLARFDDLPGFDIEHTRGVEHDGARRSR